MFKDVITRALGSVGLMRVQQSAEHLVPANTTWSQILDYASGSGQDWPFDFYSVGLPINRNTAVSYATLNRCVTLISGMVASLVTGGNLGIVDPMGGEGPVAEKIACWKSSPRPAIAGSLQAIRLSRTR